jgi:hypothetical protein
MEAKAFGSTPSYQGVCGRHGGEEARVTQGGLVSSKRQAGSGSAWSHREVGADISESEVPAEAVPGVGSGRGTQERGYSKRPRIAASSSGAGVLKRHLRGGRPRAGLGVGDAGKR